jgi:hypothetical protein
LISGAKTEMSSLFTFLFGCCRPNSLHTHRRQERSHQIARQTDATLIDRLTFLERQVAEDRVFAERLGGGGENVNRHTRMFQIFFFPIHTNFFVLIRPGVQ